MAIQGADLLSPAGEVELVLFPGESAAAVTARLDAYLVDAYAKLDAQAAGMTEAERDLAAADWAYHRAYRAVETRLAAEPASATLDDQGSRTYTAAQIQQFGKLAAAKLAAWAQRIEAFTGTAAAPVTGFVPIKSTW